MSLIEKNSSTYSVTYTGSSLSFAKRQEISTFDPRSPPNAAADGEIALASNNADLSMNTPNCT
ncbi:hypothetical protein S40285_09428 [Stachybotrys chlorohalonatus IBT 40285]|uniref:Uncharacterized protein n=1 Tax=Stachybotrys chlorohalonatus (strain IBT 40285) TaxID=1283841 RepID=A0A084QSS1_STAC4|nr:hypothetical protein S40285_09428 [Stachybotrys chlorohalonata IBT 40285]